MKIIKRKGSVRHADSPSVAKDKKSALAICLTAKSKYGIDRVVLKFSMGRDSLAAWLSLRSAGIEVVPVYHEVYPGLKCTQRWLKQYQKFFGTEIISLPHQFTLTMIRNGQYMDPAQIVATDNIDYANDTLGELTNNWMVENGFNGTYKAIAIKSCDSVRRMFHLFSQGRDFVNVDKREVFPIAQTSETEVDAIMAQHNCPLPSVYEVLGESLDIPSYRFMRYLRDYEPEDYQHVISTNPLLEAELWRKTYALNHVSE
jgi:hypothetical protein